MERKPESTKGYKSLIALVILAAALLILPAAKANARDDWQYPHPDSRGYSERLEYYESLYSDEILRFCESRYLLKIRKLGSCLRKQQSIKDAILANARHHTGSQTIAQVIYDDCLEHHPLYGVGRIGACVETRLILYERVGDIAVERTIYRKCEAKWRRSGAPAIDVCCAHEGRYYRDNGRLRD